MAKKRRSSYRGKKSGIFLQVISILVAGAILLSLLGFGIYLYLNIEKDVGLSQTDLCPESGARATYAILLDTTDELSIVTKEEIVAEILSIKNSLPRYYRLSVYTLNENGLNPNPIASVCNPGSINQMNAMARQGLTANPAMIESKYREFEGKIDTAIQSIFKQEFEASQSPLLSSLQELSSKLPAPNSIDDQQFSRGKNHIIFVSDLLEHTETFSIYNSGINFEAFKNSRATEKFGKSYSDTEISIRAVRRSGQNFTTIELAEFWARIFKQEFNSDILSLRILSGEL